MAAPQNHFRSKWKPHQRFGQPQLTLRFALAIGVMVVVSGCGGSSEVEELRGRVDELESQLEAQEIGQSSTTSPETTAGQVESTIPTDPTTTTVSTTTLAPTTTTLPPTTTTEPSLRVAGTVETSWYLAGTLIGEGGTPTCESVSGEYTIEVRDGGDRILAIAPLSGTSLLAEGIDEIGYYSLECAYTYGVSVPAEPVYSTVLRDRRNDLKIHNMNASSLPSGAPDFYVFFSCITGVGCETTVYSN